MRGVFHFFHYFSPAFCADKFVRMQWKCDVRNKSQHNGAFRLPSSTNRMFFDIIIIIIYSLCLLFSMAVTWGRKNYNHSLFDSTLYRVTTCIQHTAHDASTANKKSRWFILLIDATMCVFFVLWAQRTLNRYDGDQTRCGMKFDFDCYDHGVSLQIIYVGNGIPRCSNT